MYSDSSGDNGHKQSNLYLVQQNKIQLLTEDNKQLSTSFDAETLLRTRLAGL